MPKRMKSRPKRRQPFVRWFKDLRNTDVALVGGKNASLGEMYAQLTSRGVRVPNGFAITARAYSHFLQATGLDRGIRRLLKGLNTANLANLQSRGHAVRQAILSAPLPKDLEAEVIAAYHQLEREYGPNVDVAVRSSATAEDLPDASFAGQQETFLNIRGVHQLLDATRRCMASLFTDRAISYREDKHFDHFKVGLSVGVQKMVRSDKGASGVLFTIDTESGFPHVVVINAIFGLGENIVQGVVAPDEFVVHKPTLKAGFRPILSKKLGRKNVKMVYSHGVKPTKNVPVPADDRLVYAISDREALTLAKWGCLIEDHYSALAKRFKPMDMEWAKDGLTGQLFIVQARPETVVSRRDATILESATLVRAGRVLVTGTAVGTKIRSGRAKVIHDVEDISRFKRGDVLVTTMTDPDWEPIMKIASAIVTDEGGRTSHAAIVSRELGLPAIVGAASATRRLKTGRAVTVSCAEGDVGKVYAGKLPFRVRRLNLAGLKRPQTKIQLIFGTPELAFQTAQLPNDGVGLARQEFIISTAIGIHPLALVKYPRLKDAAARREIERRTQGYADKKKFYVDKLSQGIATIAAAFYPKEVIVRLSDFRSNEFAELIGGSEFEPTERNPMLGWRGASRYYDPAYRPAFDLECRALKKVRDGMGLKNVKVMIPFCRTVAEGQKVLAAMAENGLKQHSDGLEVFVMCEIPSNVILADQFAKVFDGFSIGSNDLTQLALGLDRDSSLVASVGNENDPAVKKLLADVIAVAKKRKKKIGICGQGPSDYPALARFLVRQGIDAISVNPDTVLKTTLRLANLEASRGRKQRRVGSR